MAQQHSEGFREQALRKVMERGERTIEDVAKELGLNTGTLKGWLKQSRRAAREGAGAGSTAMAATETHSAAARLDLLLGSAGLSGEALHAWCRERGVYVHQLDTWKAEFAQSGGSGDAVKPLRRERDALQTQCDQLQRQMQRKDKALAEAAALLVLSKKFQALLAGEDA